MSMAAAPPTAGLQRNRMARTLPCSIATSSAWTDACRGGSNMPTPDMIKDVYLGDGVYASFDGFQIWLDTRAQEPVNRIALEPETYAALLAYAARVRELADQVAMCHTEVDHGSSEAGAT